MEFDFPTIMKREDYLGLPPHEQERYVERQIKEILHRNKNGITISVINEKTPFTRPTIIKHLERFVSAREGFNRKMGNTYIYFPNGSAEYPDRIVKEHIEDGRYFKGTLLNNNFGEYVFVEEVGSHGISGGSIMIKKDEFKNFKDFIIKLSKEV